MTEKLLRITAAEAIRALGKAGFFLARQTWKPQNLQEPARKKSDCAISFGENSSPQGFKKHSERCGFDNSRVQRTDKMIQRAKVILSTETCAVVLSIVSPELDPTVSLREKVSRRR